MFKYYSKRPVDIGTYPKPENNEVVKIFNYDEYTYVSNIGRKAWGYVCYDKPLLDFEIYEYELFPEILGTLYLRCVGRDSHERLTYMDQTCSYWKNTNVRQSRLIAENRRDIILYNAYGFDGEPENPMSPHYKYEYYIGMDLKYLTEKYGLVFIDDIYSNREECRKAGYTEDAGYESDLYGILGKKADEKPMIFAAYKKNILNRLEIPNAETIKAFEEVEELKNNPNKKNL